MKILFASQNKNKQREAKELLKNLPVKLVFPDSFPELENFDVDETGATFIDNALLKARAYAELVKTPCIADDSGVIIDGMDGLPGVHSNRWFSGTDDDRNTEVLRRLENVNIKTARYVTAACYYNPLTEEHAIFEETVEGKIGLEIIGDAGFAYDRIFTPEGYDKTFAQLGDTVKNKFSQRSKAYNKLKQYLEKIY